MQRNTDEMLDEVLRAADTLLTSRRHGRRRKKTVMAVGLAPNSVSVFFIDRRTDCAYASRAGNLQ